MNTQDPQRQVDDISQAEMDIYDERRRQIDAEGWTPEHDDQHHNGSMARAAAAYAVHTSLSDEVYQSGHINPAFWPWAEKWWKPTNRRRDLVKAGALIIAEIERLDRLAARS